MSQARSELFKLSKDSLIKLAVTKIDEPSFDVNQFDQISVWSVNGEVWVYFDRFIKFVPRKSRSYYDVKVNLSSDSWTASPRGNGKSKSEKFYSTTRQDIEKSDFVIAKILESGLTQKYLDRIRENGTILIIEENKHYSVSISETPALILLYKVRKSTGEVFDKSEMNTHLDDNPSPTIRIY